MELIIRTRNLELTERSRNYVRRKIERLDRYLPLITQAKVEVAEEAARAADDRVVVQVTLDCNGTVVRGEQRAAKVGAAVDSVVDLLTRRLERVKAKVYKSNNRVPQSAAAGERADSTAEEESPQPRVVRVKRILVKPITLEEAAEQMELLGHDFFLFYNSQTDQYNVVYRRRDGNYGVIEPDSS